MRKSLVILFAAGALGAATLAPVAPAHADSAGPAIAAGFGGLALGTILGASLAQPRPVYAAPRPVYVAAPPPPPPPHCWWQRRPLYDEWGNVAGFRPRRVCE